MRLFHPLAALALVMSACTSSPLHTVGTATASALTPTQLIATIDVHKGQTVTVKGYFTYVVDTRALWEDEATHRNAEQLRKGGWDKCVTIYPSNGKVRQFSGHPVRITGKATVVDKDDMRSFWTCSEDYHEGVAAFLEKRSPTFTGR